VETISVKDGKLWSQVGKDAEEEYFALGPETFFVKDDLGSFTFVRDAQGHVTGYTITAMTDRKSTPRRSSEHEDQSRGEGRPRTTERSRPVEFAHNQNRLFS
jgi:hypothetical protein